MRTRVCRLHGQKDLRVESVETRRPGPDEVAVAVAAGGICGSDLHYWADGGIGHIRVQEPIILGHEAAGTVVEAGEDVASPAAGDVVVLNPSHPCGDCRYCAEKNFQHCLNMRFKGSAMYFPHEQGMFRDRVVIAARRCHKVAEGVGAEEAACAEPLAVCLHALGRALGHADNHDFSGRRVLVTGAGPIGALCAALARRANAAEVVVTDIQPATLGVARRMGATSVVNVGENPGGLDPWKDEKGRFDFCFECSASPSAVRSALEAVRPLGTVVQVGVCGEIPFPLNFLVGKEINFLGTHRFHGEFARAVEMINSGDISLAPIITHHFPLSEAALAFETAADRSLSVKVLIDFAASASASVSG